jgi:hypothetical protein
MFLLLFLVLPKKAKLNKKIWVFTIVLALALSLLLAYNSVTSVWRPHRMQHDYLDVQNSAGEYEGVSPWSKLSYPFSLNVFHELPPLDGDYLPQNDIRFGYEYGQVRFTLLIVNLRTIMFNGTYWFSPVRGWTPMHYEIYFIFSNQDGFYDFLIALFTTLNMLGALLGIIVARTARGRFRK